MYKQTKLRDFRKRTDEFLLKKKVFAKCCWKEREGRGTCQPPVSERGYAMLLAQLALVAGGVGTEAYDSVFNDQVCVCVCVLALRLLSR